MMMRKRVISLSFSFIFFLSFSLLISSFSHQFWYNLLIHYNHSSTIFSLLFFNSFSLLFSFSFTTLSLSLFLVIYLHRFSFPQSEQSFPTGSWTEIVRPSYFSPSLFSFLSLSLYLSISISLCKRQKFSASPYISSFTLWEREREKKGKKERKREQNWEKLVVTGDGFSFRSFVCDLSFFLSLVLSFCP